MSLVDMKLPKKSKKDLVKVADYEIERDRYPYGLQLRFENEQVEALPSLKNYKVGDKVRIEAEANVTSVRQSELQDKKASYVVEIQIERIAVEPKVNKPAEKMTPKEYREMRERSKKHGQ